MKSCYKCKERTLNCHSYCKDYDSYRKRLDKIKENKKQEYIHRDYEIKRIERMRKLKRSNEIRR